MIISFFLILVIRILHMNIDSGTFEVRDHTLSRPYPSGIVEMNRYFQLNSVLVVFSFFNFEITMVFNW